MAFNITPVSLLSGASTLNNLLTNALKIDVVAVLNQDSLQQVFANARPLKAIVKETAKVMEYPVETGAVISDHKVNNPTEIEMLFIIPSDAYSTAFQEIRNAWLNATMLSVQTRVGTYRNMIIADRPHEEDPEMFNAITQSIRFKEVLFVAGSNIAEQSNLQNYEPIDPQNAQTVNRGLLTAITSAGSGLSYFNALSVWGK